MSEKEFKDRAFNSMVEAILKRYPDYDESRVRFQLIEMITTHGKDAVEDLYGFLLWSRIENKSDAYIWANIMHDFGGSGDATMAPRTYGFAKEYLKTKYDVK